MNIQTHMNIEAHVNIEADIRTWNQEMDIFYETKFSTPLSNSTLLPLLLLSLARQRHTPVTSATFKDEYDYIVVGAGAAGCVVASRLTEKSCVDVLLLEAGDKPPILTEVPGLARYLKNYLNWHYTTVPQKYTGRGFINRQVQYARGKTLGGSGTINGLVYVRGNHKDYDNWAAMGAKGWSYKDVFPYFVRLEDEKNRAFLSNGYHGVGGPITAESPNYYIELKQAVYEAGMALGYDIVDSNAEKQVGVYAEQGFTRDGQRCNSLKGYIVPVNDRENLDILTNALVTKIIMEGNKATGVEFFYKGRYQVVKARKEVILSGGAVNTPQVLILSGIGPRDELNKLNIPMVVDLPVGKNFQDHAGSDYFFTLNKRFRGFDDKIADPSNILEYIFNRRGPLASINTLNTAFLKSLNESSFADDPEFELYVNELEGTYATDLGLKPKVYKQYFEPYEGQAVFTCKMQTLVPKSRGTITLNSSNPFDPPLIDPNYLQDPADLTVIVNGFKTCKKLLNMEPLLKLDAKPFETVLPGCEKYFDNEEEYFKCFARTILYTCYHPVGTCKMGEPTDPTTVVDPELRVKGIQGLRVVDASVMPVLTSGNTFIPVVMIAEKASDIIKSSIMC